VDVVAGTVTNNTTGKAFQIKALLSDLLAILNADCLVTYRVRQRDGER
jgi:hypothetical protein